MLFNSYVFILFFLPVTVLGYFALNHLKQYILGKVYLILMSFWFYAYFHLSYLWIMLSSILINYALGQTMLCSQSKRKSQVFLALGLLFNVGILFYFKYFDFFLVNLNTLFGSDFLLQNIMLPLGISFFTFQQLSYVIDCYHQKVPKYHLFDYALFVTFFPQLVAGPIVLHNEIVPQFADQHKKKLNYDNVAKGLYALSLGLGKKVLLADSFGIFVSYGYSHVAILNTTEALFVMLAYTLQIYFDFSGYCDIATGVGLLFNIDIPMNFNSPYKATTILEFWKRWHITLTRFFTTYVYIPLGGNRMGISKTYVNIIIVFLCSGIWHGANWTFIVWGLLHGIASVLTRVFYKSIEKIPKWINWFITFLFINLTWVIFRADSLQQAGVFFSRLSPCNFGALEKNFLDAGEAIVEIHVLLKSMPSIVPLCLGGLIFISYLFALFGKNTTEKLSAYQLSSKTFFTTYLWLVWSILSFAGVSTFIYFNF